MNEAVTTLRFWDGIAVFLYAASMVALAMWSSKRIKAEGTEGFFVGGRAIPGWAVGLSMLGTAISSITFLAYPGSAYAGDWSRLVPGLMLPVTAMIALRYFVVFYRKTLFRSAYEYFNRRFGAWGRSYASALFILGSIYRMGIILFLISIAVTGMTGWGMTTVMIVVGALIVLYTAVGGLEAVIWTDVLQTIVLMFGGVITLVIVFWGVEGGVSAVVGQAWDAGKFNLSVDFDFSLVKLTFWTFALMGLVGNVQEFSTDQTKIQRYAAAKDDKGALTSVLTVGFGCIPIWGMFMLVGTVLWVYFQVHPDSVVSGLKADAVYPHFILTRMPPFLGGVVISAVLAAAMSSIDSSMNGSATVITEDFFRRYISLDRSDEYYLKAARYITGGLGVLMVVTAYLLSLVGETTILDLGMFVGAVLTGGLGGFFLLGFVSTRTNWQGALIGVALTFTFTLWAGLSALGALPEWMALPIQRFFIGVVANVLLFGVGYLSSYFFPPPSEEQLHRMTWWTRE